MPSSFANVQGTDVDSVVASLTDELVQRFTGAMDPEVVARTVADCAADFREAPIATYLAILVERRCVERLRNEVAPGMAGSAKGAG